jgi:hypothetical protein
VRQGLLDHLGAASDLAARAGVTGIAQPEDVDRRERPLLVGLRVQHAFDRDVLVGQAGDRRRERAVWRAGRLVGLRRSRGLGRWQEAQRRLGGRCGSLGPLGGHVDAQRSRLGLVRGGLAGTAPKATGRATGEAHGWSQAAAALPRRPDHVTQRPIGRDDDPDEQERDERDGPAHLAERAGRDARDGRPDHPARSRAQRGVAALVVLRDRQERDEHDHAPCEGHDRAASHESEPHLRREGREQHGHRERAPAEQRDEERVPPVQHRRTLIGDEGDDRQHREREQCDGADLVADAGVHRGDRSALRLPSRHPARAHTCMITGSTIGRRFVRS